MTKTSAVILCTYNGERFLREQLDSLQKQDSKDFKLFLFDDCSEDKTIDILQEFKRNSHLDIEIFQNEKKLGFCNNFLNGLKSVPDTFDYYFFCDQDDIWLKHKISKSIEKLRNMNNLLPKLYCSRTLLIDKRQRVIGKSPLFRKKPNFTNAIVQSIAGGNTMGFNLLLKKALNEINTNVKSHDWLAYLVCSALDGEIFYDSKPTVLYRQHKKNSIGNNMFISSKLDRAHSFFIKNEFRGWVQKNIIAIENLKGIEKSNFEVLETFKHLRRKELTVRVMSFFKSGIYRQSLLGNIGLFIGSIFRKIY